MTPEPLDVMIEYPSGAAGPAFVTSLGNDRYRIEGDTLCFFVAEDARELRRVPRCGDVIEARAIDDHTLEFVKVVTRARLKRVQFFISPQIAESPRLESILACVMDLGGQWDRVFGGILIMALWEVEKSGTDHATWRWPASSGYFLRVTDIRPRDSARPADRTGSLAANE
jgi:hypothetical protein